MDQVSESVSKMACKNCGRVIVIADLAPIWKHEATGLILCSDREEVAEPEQAMSS